MTLTYYSYHGTHNVSPLAITIDSCVVSASSARKAQDAMYGEHNSNEQWCRDFNIFKVNISGYAVFDHIYDCLFVITRAVFVIFLPRSNALAVQVMLCWLLLRWRNTDFAFEVKAVLLCRWDSLLSCLNCVKCFSQIIDCHVELFLFLLIKSEIFSRTQIEYYTKLLIRVFTLQCIIVI